jgi:RHS repeat-associated protein
MISSLTINQSYNAMAGTWSNSGVSLGNNRKYDVWGKVRGPNAAGYPNNKYCANLGHVTDDELGLIYMRARYYEPSSGRFISEDPAGDGANWYAYGKNNPVQNIDFNGKVAWVWLTAIAMGVFMFAMNGDDGNFVEASFGLVVKAVNFKISDLIASALSIPEQITDAADVAKSVAQAIGAIMSIRSLLIRPGIMSTLLSARFIAVFFCAAYFGAGLEAASKIGAITVAHSMRLAWYVTQTDVD